MKILNSMMGTGANSGMTTNRTEMMISSPRMLANKRNVSEKVRASYEEISTGSIRKMGST